MTDTLSPAAYATSAEQITTLVKTIRPTVDSAAPLDPATPLTGAGVSSLDMVNLMLAIEAAFDIFIPAELIGPKTFRSIGSIAAMVDAVKLGSLKAA